MSELLCPHCQERGCDGRCRFKVGRRGFLGLGLGALASGLLPTPEPCAYLEFIGRVHDGFYYNANEQGILILEAHLKRLYSHGFAKGLIVEWDTRRKFLEGRSWPK